MKRLSCFFMSLCLVCFAAAPSLAQAIVSVRSGIHNDYVRLVFDWDKSVSYTLSPNDDGLRLFFGDVASLSTESLDLSGLAFIRDIKSVSGADSALEIQIDTDKNMGADYRHFKVGNRVVVDFMGQSNPAPPSASQENAQPDKAMKKAAPSPPEAKPVPDEPMEKNDSRSQRSAPATSLETKDSDKKLSSSSSPARAPEYPESEIMAKAPDIEPHLISMSVTEAVGVAAFRRGDDLWIVMDRTGIVVPPQLEGPQTEKFSDFERFDLKNGTAYRLKMPENNDLNLYGEGGGLVWRLIISPNAKSASSEPALLERRFESGSTVRGGTAFWPLLNTTRVVEVTDPDIGDVVSAVPVKRSTAFTGTFYDFVDFSVLESPIGMAVEPKTDTLEIQRREDGVAITQPDGLAMSRNTDVHRREMRKSMEKDPVKEKNADSAMSTIFNFDRWMMGGLDALSENQRIVLSNAADKNKEGQAQDLISLAKVNLANDRGQESIGLLGLAAQIVPEITESPEFIALRGASYAAAGKHEMALDDLSDAALADYDELDYWRAYTLAWLEDWQQASVVMPDDFEVLMTYPIHLLEKLGIKLAEIALRNGDVETAQNILGVLEKERANLDGAVIAGLEYLGGEAARQRGDLEKARELWTKLAKGNDDFYRARAGLALTLMDHNDGKIESAEAIDRLEGLRYAWRGDGLEAQVNAELGTLYLQDNQFMKGFTILRDAAAMTPGTDTGREITQMMSDEFYDLLMNDEDISPIAATTVYEEFKELTPTGREGNLLTQRLAERLIDADLLGRATRILQHQVDFRLDEQDKARVALRLGAVYLLDGRPQEALDSLNDARVYYARQSAVDTAATLDEIRLLRARALSELNRTAEALRLLNSFDPEPDVNRLRADISWQAGLWDDAAEALQDLILDEDIDPSQPLDDAQSDLVLNRAVALNLSGNRVALANMRERYGDAMNKTNRADLFDVVTLPRKNMVFMDRETIDALVDDVDIFSDFLESYKTKNVGTNEKAAP